MSFTPALEYVFEIRAHIAPELHIGNGDGESTEFVPITGGSVDGPRLTGKVLAGGGDWSSTRGDICELEARYLLQADDGAVIDIVNRGYYRPDADGPDQFDGEIQVTEKGHYYRTSPVFRTDAPTHRWLAENVFIGLARPDGDDVVVIRMYMLR
jgi:uncharacterized protein DUF3237